MANLTQSSYLACKAFAVLVLFSACDTPQSQQQLSQEFGTLPSFQLTESNGKAFTEKEMVGGNTIVSFMFTRCDTLCPELTARMKWVEKNTREFSNPPLLLSISVDPEHDTPEVLSAYKEKMKITSPRWHFVTGDSLTVQSMVKESFFLAMEKKGLTKRGTPNIIHSDRFLLIDPGLKIRGFYHTDEQVELRKLVAAAQR